MNSLPVALRKFELFTEILLFEGWSEGLWCDAKGLTFEPQKRHALLR